MRGKLDNPIWHSLHEQHANFAISHGRAVRFLPDVSPLSAVSESSEAALADLEQIVEVGDTIGIWLDTELPLGAGWQVVLRFPLVQMLCERAVESSSDEFEELTQGDAKEMLSLADRTEPGPFSLRSGELGRFVGIREDGRLLAIAGERFRFDGYTELSGVCTDPSARGRGYGERLCRVITSDIQARGDQAFLHVVPVSATAGTSMPLYERMGYRETGRTTLSILKRL